MIEYTILGFIFTAMFMPIAVWINKDRDNKWSMLFLVGIFIAIFGIIISIVSFY